MKWLIILQFFFCYKISAEVSAAHVDEMLDQMVSNNVISKLEAEKAKIRLRSMSPEQWREIRGVASKVTATRGPASETQSVNKIEEVKSVDLDSAQFKQIQDDIGKIVPQYKN